MRNTALVLTLLGATACSPHTVTHNPTPPIETPAAYSEAASSAPMPEKWWLDFGDPELERLIAAALEGNTQLRAAWARVRQSQAMARQAKAALFPQVDLSASASRSQQRFNLPMIGEQKLTSNNFSVSAGAGYEVDLWNKVGSVRSAAELAALASRDNVEALAMSTAADVAEVWYGLVDLEAQRALLTQQLEVSRTYLELTELRFQQGLVSALDVYQQEQVVVGLRAQLIQVESGRQVAAHGLAMLTGKPPRALTVAAPSALPDLPPIPSVGVPADLLERRPDVRAMRKRVEAIDYQIAAAIADRLPGIRLSGALTLQDSSITEIIAAPLYSLMASIGAPLFDGGRRRAVVDQRRAELDEALWNYATVMLAAMTEVENALVQERQQRLYIAELELQVELSGKALREARERYRQGLIQYLPVLTALQGEQRTQLALQLARRQLISHRIQLCRALGGSWTGELAEPTAVGAK